MFWKRNKSKSPKEDEIKKEGEGENANYFLKIALLGDGAVGKTNIRRNYLGQGFSREHLMTIGADFAAAEREIELDGKKYDVTFQIWDLAGQKNFDDVRSMYYRGCFGGLIVFDITRPSSFENLDGWISELSKNSGKGEVPMVVLGNKYDLVDEAEHVVDAEKIQEYIDELNEDSENKGYEISYMNTSALTGRNIDKAFNSLGKSILKWIGVSDK